MLKQFNVLVFCMGLLLITSLSYAEQTPPKPWVAVHLLIFKQQTSNDSTKSPPIEPPSLPSPYQQLALNTEHDQLPLLNHQPLDQLTKQLTQAGYHILYATSWQQPTTTPEDAKPHYLIDLIHHYAPPPSATITTHGIAMDQQAHSNLINPTPITFESTSVAPNIHDTSPDVIAAAQFTPQDATQDKLRNILPHAFSEPYETIDASDNTFIKGTINLSLNKKRYQATLSVYQYDSADEPPAQWWHTTQQLYTNKTNYLDNTQLGAIIQIKTIPSPIPVYSAESGP
jgi:hypothetical protein